MLVDGNRPLAVARVR